MKRILTLTVIVLGLSGCSSWQSVENVTPSNPTAFARRNTTPFVYKVMVRFCVTPMLVRRCVTALARVISSTARRTDVT